MAGKFKMGTSFYLATARNCTRSQSASSSFLVKHARVAQSHSVYLGGTAHWLTGVCYLEAGPKATALGCVALQHHLITSLVAKRSMDPFAIQRYQHDRVTCQASTVFGLGMVSDPL